MVAKGGRRQEKEKEKKRKEKKEFGWPGHSRAWRGAPRGGEPADHGDTRDRIEDLQISARCLDFSLTLSQLSYVTEAVREHTPSCTPGLDPGLRAKGLETQWGKATLAPDLSGDSRGLAVFQ